MTDHALEPIPLGLASAAPQVFAQRLGESFVRTGFAVVAEHGLDGDLLAACAARTRALFALPAGAKARWRVEGGGGQRGYTPFGVEAAKGASAVDLKEFWHIGRELPADHPYASVMPANIWPEGDDGFRRDLYGLFAALDLLGGRLMDSIADFLDVPRDFLADATRDGNSILRLLHYPPQQANPSGVRAGAHEDINAITLLLGAEEAGLQAKTRDGRWLDINPPADCIVINVGDMLDRLTNGRLPSTTHRVVNPTPDRAHLPRYSFPFFMHFRPGFVIEALPGCVGPGMPAPRPPITAQDYLMERLREIRLI